ncbi:hypothetical protein CONLIGDRAFT_140143 [Coniochaeta ligniaria NRRL 30616]|uniref:Uncharacterized protein n=1 Tax=Coniochaeta ligniaria NRRL 30616 TaxID=1408157 RepID=A0A1J7J1G2_9PEZI|nr:hypothetical protein CONLIGDRAFT_140143 [Coniochaeta ligniaria NRRL 30616]
MFEHYTFGMQAQPVRRRSRELSPREAAAAGEQCQSQCPSPPLSATTVSPSTRTGRDSKSAPDSIDSLAQELSKQNLQLDRANLAHLQIQLSSPLLSPSAPCMPPIPPCLTLKIDDERRPRQDSRRRRPSPPALPTLSHTPMEVDQPPIAADEKRLVRQRSSQFHNNPNNSQAIQTLVEGMIASRSQCNVHRVSPPALTLTSAKRVVPISDPDDDIKLDLECMDLQVDEAYANGPSSDAEKEEKFLIETMTSLRRAAAPAGVRKPGYLQYRASADSALSCANVVRSRPRMRKRSKAHRRSKASSMISSPICSPVIPPSLPDELRIPSRHPNA